MPNPDYAHDYHDEMTAALQTFDELIANIKSRDEYGDPFLEPVARIIANQALSEFIIGKLEALDVIDAIQTESLKIEHENKAILVRMKVRTAKKMLTELEEVTPRRVGA